MWALTEGVIEDDSSTADVLVLDVLANEPDDRVARR